MPDPQPSRRPQISRGFLEQHRRRRYVEASAELLHEFGREGASVANIVRLAGTARNSFYEVFTGAEDCLAHGIGLAAAELFAALDAQDGEGDWLVEVHSSIAGFYGVVANRPILAELFLVHSAVSRVDHGRAAFREGPEGFASLLRRGRGEAEAADRPPLPAPLEAYLSRLIVSLAARRVRSPGVEGLAEDSGAVAALVGGYYLGFEEAADRVLVLGAGSARP